MVEAYSAAEAQDYADSIQASFEARASSQEVRILNDMAEIATYGTRGRTAGYLDEHGNPLTAPIPGKIEDIRNTDGSSRAAAYEKEVDQLLNEGYQLCQVKLIMDKRETKVDKQQPLLDWGYRNWSQDQDDVQLKRVVREAYIFTPEDYRLVTMQTNQPPTDLQEAVDEARNEYVQLSAERGAHIIRLRKKYQEESVARAREHYEQRKQELLRYECDNALETGAKPETLGRYALVMATSEASRLAREMSDARKLASGKWIADDIHIHTTGEHHGVVPVLDEAPPLARIKRFFFGKLWGKRDPDTSSPAQDARLVARRTAITLGIPATLVGSILVPPIGTGLVIAGGAGLLRWAGKKLADWQPGYKPGRTAKWILGREMAHEDVLFSAAASVIPNTIRRKNYSQAELEKALGLALLHANSIDPRMLHLDDTIADMIDEETKESVLLSTYFNTGSARP